MESSLDLHGLEIGFYESLELLMPNLLRDPKLRLTKVVGEHWYLRAVDMLVKGHLEAIYMPEKYPLIYSLNTKSLKKQYKIIRVPGDIYRFHMVFSEKSKMGPVAKKRYDQVEKTLSRKYNQMIMDFWNSPDCLESKLAPFGSGVYQKLKKDLSPQKKLMKPPVITDNKNRRFRSLLDSV